MPTDPAHINEMENVNLVTLTEDEKAIMDCLRDAWVAQDMPLYGRLCYQQVYDLFDKLGLGTGIARKELCPNQAATETSSLSAS